MSASHIAWVSSFILYVESIIPALVTLQNIFPN